MAEPWATRAAPTDVHADAVYRLQLLASLAPLTAERLMERLLVRSLLLLQDVAPTSPGYRALKAREETSRGARVLSKPFHLRELVSQIDMMLSAR